MAKAKEGPALDFGTWDPTNLYMYYMFANIPLMRLEMPSQVMKALMHVITFVDPRTHISPNPPFFVGPF